MIRSVLPITLGVAAALSGCPAPAPSGTPAAPVDLAAHERTVFSQFQEDGVIEKLLELIPPTHRYVVEFGAHDGVTKKKTPEETGEYLLGSGGRRAAMFVSVAGQCDAFERPYLSPV